MDEPLPVAASATNLLSSGMQSIDYLYQYYTGCRRQHDNLADTADRLGDLLYDLRTIDGVVRTPQRQSNEQAAVQIIERSIARCNDVINELEEEVRKFKNLAANTSSNAVRNAGQRAAHPLRESTLKKLDEDITEFHSNLSMLLQKLQLQGDYGALICERNISRPIYREREATSQPGYQQSNISIDGYAQVHFGDNFVQNDMKEMEEVVKEIQAQYKNADLRQWLRAPDAMFDFNNTSAKRHTGTGQWLVRSPAFTTWLQRANSFLWLYGFAGCGKSVLCSTVIQYTFWQSSPTDSAVAFFFFTFDDESKQDASAALRALLLQLYQQVPVLEKDLIQLKELYTQGTPPAPILLEYLRQAVSRCRHVWLLLDALDESPAGYLREEVLSMIETIRQWEFEGLHLLVTSRDILDIREHLHSSTPDPSKEYIALKNDSIQQDISRYVSFRIDHDRQLRRWGDDHRETIKRYLTQHAGGVFRWVECQLRSLRQCPRSEKHLESCLRALPRSLDETYELMLNSIEPREEARQILSLLCFASRPLSVDEMVEALAVDTRDLECYDPRSKLTGGADDLLRICPGLIEIRLRSSIANEAESEIWDSGKDQEIVRIAHFSVQEYLLSDRIKNGRAMDFALSRTSQHEWISKVCLLYLNHDDFLQRALTADLLAQYAFARYAARHWHHHYREAGRAVAEQLSKRAASWLVSCQTLRRWIKLYDPDRPESHLLIFDDDDDGNDDDFAQDCFSPIYYASLLGLDIVLLYLLSEPTADVNAHRSDFRCNALGAASWFGCEKVVQMLLDKGANVNAQGGPFGNALQVALCRGHAGVVKLLLEYGARKEQ